MTSTEQAAARPPAPWGSPPTPLLPRWYIDTQSAVRLPGRVRMAAAPRTRQRTVGDLPRFWDHRSEPLNKESLQSVVNFAASLSLPPSDHIVVAQGTEIRRLLGCPLRVRTRNCLRRALPSNSESIQESLTVGQLLQMANFGIASLLDLMCVTEAAQQSDFLVPRPAVHCPESALPPDPPDPSAVAWLNANTLLKKLLTVSAELDGSVTLEDALNSDLVGIAGALGISKELNSIELRDLTDGPTLSEEALGDLAASWLEQSPTAQMIVANRLISDDPPSLQELAEEAGLSRERIRQVQKKIRHDLLDSGPGRAKVAIISALLRPKIPPITSEDEFERQIFSIFPEDALPGGSPRNDSQLWTGAELQEDFNSSVVNVARYLLRTELKYSNVNGLVLSPDAVVVMEDLKRVAHDIADDEGIVNEHQLREHLPGDGWAQYWETLTEIAGFHSVDGLILLRDTGRARVKAAVLSIGRPATKEEIAERCGIAPSRVSSQLTAISDVVRADKIRWGLADWVEDEYEGIPAEIIQRIEEDGGATRLERLLEELPRLFGVSAGSVEAYAKSPRFKINDGYVSLADPSLITLRDLDDVTHGRTAEGLPFFSFKVESRYLDGYSLAGLPPEIAKSLGCEPDGRLRVPIVEPTGCGPVSVNWPLSSLTGANLGYLSAPLRALGAKQGDRINLVLETSGAISLRRPGPSESATADPDESNQSSDRASELLKRMKQRRRGF